MSQSLDIRVDGVRLSSLAWGITEGTAVAAPGRRTADVVVPGRHGVIAGGWEPFEDRDFAISMYVLGANPDGTVPEAGTLRREAFELNLRRLMGLLTRRGVPLELQRILPGRPAESAEARVVAAITPEITSGLAARVGVVFNIPGVFWRGPRFQIEVPLGSSIGPHTFAVPGIEGTHEVDDLAFELAGPTSVAPRLTCVATGSWIECPRPLGTGDVWKVDCAAFTSAIGSERAWPKRSSPTRMWTLSSRTTSTDQPVEVTLNTKAVGLVITGRATAL